MNAGYNRVRTITQRCAHKIPYLAGPFHLTSSPTDLDGDGDLDALSAGKRRATLWWNDGQGRFKQADQSFPCSERQDLTTGDFDGDGQADIFIAGYDKSAEVWFNDGQGGFFLQ